MEAKNMKNNSESKGKKRAKMSIALGLGGDIGGLIVLGGALAVAGFFATFVVKRRKTMAYSNGKRPLKSSKYMPKKDQQDYGNQGLRFLLQTSTTTTSDHEDSSTMSENAQDDQIFTKTDDILEIQKIAVLDSSEKEITALSDGLCPAKAECSALENIPIESEDVYLVEKDVDEESVVSVDVNEGCSMDLHANIVCSAEIVEDTMPELQTHETQSIHKEVKSAIADNCTHFTSDIDSDNHVAEKNMIVNVQSAQFFKVRVWILSMLIVAMLFLSLQQVYRKVVPVIL